jgi:hypothetical protein
MINRKASDVENKLLVLLAVDQLGPLTNLQLLQFLAENDLMDYITLQLNLGELMDARHLEKTPHALGPLYTLTMEGRESLALFSRRIPHSSRSLIKDSAAGWRARFQREKQVLSDFHRQDGGTYALKLRLMEKDQPLLETTLILPSRDTADHFSRNWPKAAADFYGFLIRELGGDFSVDVSPGGQLPEGTAITREYAQGCALYLKREGSPAIQIILALPTEPMAASFAARWPDRMEAIGGFLLERLAEE